MAINTLRPIGVLLTGALAMLGASVPFPPTSARAQVTSGPIARLLEAGEPVFGVFVREKTLAEGERMAENRQTDFVFYSMEQGPFDIPAMQAFVSSMTGAAQAAGYPARPLVLRVPPVGEDPDATRERVGQAIEAGVGAIVFPHVRTREEATVAVGSMKTARGKGGVWPLDSNGDRVNMLIIEDQSGIANAHEIAATPGVSVVFAGPGDLNRAYDGDTEAVEEAIQAVLAACKEADVPCGITAGAADIVGRLEEGFRVIIVTEQEALGVARQHLREQQVAREMRQPRPIAALDSVWIEELTWMEVRDALAGGKRTAIVTTGGIEQNGPYLATGKHNVVLEAACERIARTLGDALCAPILKLVPEGGIDPPSGHMMYPGTLSLRPETFEMVLEDVASSLAAHGFEHVVFIGDSGGNQRGMARVAEALNRRWKRDVVLYIAEFYRYPELLEWMRSELGVIEPVDEGLHDDPAITSMMMTVDPSTVRYEQRVAAGRATINGVSLVPPEEMIELGEKLLDRRVEQTVAAIRAATTGG